jgi:hypothetical protein
VTVDNQFAPLAELLYDLPGALALNLTSTNEHKPYIERRIHVVKERARAVQHSMPFTSIPSKMLTHMVFFVVKLLNLFPTKSRVLTEYSPKQSCQGKPSTISNTCFHSAPTARSTRRMDNATVSWPEPKEQFQLVPHLIGRVANSSSPSTQGVLLLAVHGLSYQCLNPSLHKSTNLLQTSQAF